MLALIKNTCLYCKHKIHGGACMTEEVTGKAKGGKARAEKLTPERRREIAQRGGKARWEYATEDLPKAEYRGNLDIGNITIPCAVLENGKRVISDAGITNAMLGGRSGASKRLKKAHELAGAPMPMFLAPNILKPFISDDLTNGPLTPLKYRDKGRVITGYDATLLPAVCDVWLKAREAGALQKQQLDKAQKAETLMRGLAHVGIIALVDEATGYQEVRDRDELSKLLEVYLSAERLKWAKLFPDEFYKQIYRLRNWKYPNGARRTPLVGKITNEIVYEKLPPGVLEELKKRNPTIAERKRRRWKHTQFLSDDIGQPDLRDHLLQVIALMRASSNWPVFKRLFLRAFPSPGDQMLLDIEDE